MTKPAKNSIELSARPLVVGTVHSSASFPLARRMRLSEVDLLELRVDAFAASPEPLLKLAPKLRVPLIVTVRHPRECGAGHLTARRRRELFEQFLPHAAAIDIELRSARELAKVAEAAREKGIRVILSHHDFQRTPGAKTLLELSKRAADAGADIFKVAATASSPRELAALLEFMGSEDRLPLSAMAMGRYGKISRLLLAACGSVLNYGYLDTANASGQWPALLLKKRIAEVLLPRGAA